MVLTVVDKFILLPSLNGPSTRRSRPEASCYSGGHRMDRGLQFVAMFWVESCKLIGVSLNGQTERLNQEPETVLRVLCSDNPGTWSISYLVVFGYHLSCWMTRFPQLLLL